MTVSQPSVMTLEPVTEGRHPVRVTAPPVKTPSTDIAAPHRDLQAVPNPQAAEAERAHTWRRTQTGLRLAGLALKTLAIAGMLVFAYLTVTEGWIGDAASALVDWYTATIAPYLSIDPVVTKLPVGDGAMFMDAPRPSFVVPD